MVMAERTTEQRQNERLTEEGIARVRALPKIDLDGIKAKLVTHTQGREVIDKINDEMDKFSEYEDALLEIEEGIING